MSQIKPTDIKILTITSSQSTGGAIMTVPNSTSLDGRLQSTLHVFGLGSDENIYQWSHDGKWILFVSS